MERRTGRPILLFQTIHSVTSIFLLHRNPDRTVVILIRLFTKSPTPTSSGGLTRPYKGDYLHAQRAGVASTVTGYRIMRSILLSWTLRTVPGYTS